MNTLLTSDTRRSKTHLSAGDYKPVCNARTKQTVWQIELGEACTCKRCLAAAARLAKGVRK